MKNDWSLAIRKYAEIFHIDRSKKFLIPRKGTIEHKMILEIMKEIMRWRMFRVERGTFRIGF